MEFANNLAALSDIEIDAIGEIMNISMGSAATALSTMLDKQVTITTPHVTLEPLGDVDYGTLEPAMLVKITYVQGISGSNVMVFRQNDMQVILNQLMGRDDPPSDDFVFDELSMSAACEVMNQMMGSSATALSGFLGKSINISTPEAHVMDDTHTFVGAIGISSEDEIVSISFHLCIDNVINSEFIVVMTYELARGIVSQVMGEETSQATASTAQLAPPAAPVKQTPQAAPVPMTPPQAPHQVSPQVSVPTPQPAPPMPLPNPTQPNQQFQPHQMPPQQPYDPYMAPPMQQGMPYPGMPQGMQGYPPMPYYPPYGYMPPMQPQYPQPQVQSPSPTNDKKKESSSVRKSVDVMSPQFPTYSTTAPGNGDEVMGNNMDLIMNVSLNVSVEIGKTKKKIKDIMDYTQGTVIELEKQAGAPVDIIVNGQLIARGDVVVIDDNFGVRITEIIGTKELLNTL